MRLRRLSLFALASLLASPCRVRAEPLRISLREAIDRAMEQSLPVLQAQAGLEEVSSQRRAALGRLGPKLSLEGNVMRWKDEVLFEMPPPSAGVLARHGAVLANYGDLMSALPDLFNFGPIQEKRTSQLTLSISQPITPMAQLVKGYQAATCGRDAAREDLRAVRGSQALVATQAYVGLKHANETVEIAQEAVRLVEAHLERVRTFRDVGLIGRNDVLKAEVALAEANERLIMARAAAAVAQTALALTLGLPPEQEIVPVEQLADPPPEFDASLEACVEVARRKRPELTAVAKRVSQAKLARDIARWAIVPQLVAVAGYQHAEGHGMFAPENAYFVGGVLKWDLEWGAKWNAASAASAKARQAQVGARLLSDAVYLEVKTAFHDLKAAGETLQVTRAAVINSEESLRIEQERFDVQASTTTDVLDAQLALTMARLSHSAALYRSYVSRASMLKAMGTITERQDDAAGTRADRSDLSSALANRSGILEDVQ
jgi:outer membrane protein